MNSMPSNQTAVFAGGCFWCTEAIFEQLRGVITVMPGYTDGDTKDPTYEQVCSGTTGHAEAIRVTFDPGQISYRDLLTVFFSTHNPTTRNRQGADVGTQYRSAVFYATPEQETEAEAYIKKLEASDPGGNPVVTELAPLGTFYEAERYHRGYYRNNQDMPYCQVVIEPKVEKLQKEFVALLKEKQKS